MSSDKINVMMVGAGEYTTGFVHGSASKSDKTKGVVGLVMFDLRRRGKVGTVGCVGTNGKKMPRVREHMKEVIGDCYADMDCSLSTFPPDHVERDPQAFKAAIDSLSPGDAITVFTPDNTHFEIALYAVRKGVHVMLTKPAVMSVLAHQFLVEEAERNNVLVQVEFHKRWDPIYADAREKIRDSVVFGEFQHWVSHMTQPRDQLSTFSTWAGKASDISYYLNSHHIDIHCWSMQGRGAPKRVMGVASTGVASREFGCPEGTEDTITLITEWENHSGSVGTAVYTASWAAPDNSEVHSQQRFCCMGHKGEVRADQAHRGYEVCQGEKYKCVNPMYMKYTPDSLGRFDGQRGYGYLSFESFIDHCRALNGGHSTVEALNKQGLPTLSNSLLVTAILEGGRRSLDRGGEWVDIGRLLRGEGKVEEQIKFVEVPDSLVKEVYGEKEQAEMSRRRMC